MEQVSERTLVAIDVVETTMGGQDVPASFDQEAPHYEIHPGPTDPKDRIATRFIGHVGAMRNRVMQHVTSDLECPGIGSDHSAKSNGDTKHEERDQQKMNEERPHNEMACRKSRARGDRILLVIANIDAGFIGAFGHGAQRITNQARTQEQYDD